MGQGIAQLHRSRAFDDALRRSNVETVDVRPVLQLCDAHAARSSEDLREGNGWLAADSLAERIREAVGQPVEGALSGR